MVDTNGSVLDIDAMHLPKRDVVLFGPSNPNWNDIPEYNLFFVISYQSMFTDKLHAQGHIFLNDVLVSLGFDRVRSGQFLGWSKDKHHYVEFNTKSVSNGSIEIYFPDLAFILNELGD